MLIHKFTKSYNEVVKIVYRDYILSTVALLEKIPTFKLQAGEDYVKVTALKGVRNYSFK